MSDFDGVGAGDLMTLEECATLIGELSDRVKQLEAMLSILDGPYETGSDYETGEAVIYRIDGNINDREFHEVSRGTTAMDALAALLQEGSK